MTVHRHKNSLGKWVTVSDGAHSHAYASAAHTHPPDAALTARVTKLEEQMAIILAQPVLVPRPSAFDFTFVGTGGDDTAALKAFIEGHLHKNLALSGTIYVTQVAPAVTAGVVTKITWLPGAKVICTDTSFPFGGVFRINTCADLTLTDADIAGTSYQWDTVNGSAEEQDGIHIAGGSNITLVNPYCHDTRGDGIYINVNGANVVPTGIVITNPNMQRNSRNGITINSGFVTVTDGTIDRTGLHSIDVEPNDAVQAAGVNATISHVRMTRHSDLNVHDAGGGKITGLAVASVGYVTGVRTTATKPLVDVQNCSSDRLDMAMQRNTTGRFKNNHSDVALDGNNGTDVVFEFGNTTWDASGNTGPSGTTADYIIRHQDY